MFPICLLMLLRAVVYIPKLYYNHIRVYILCQWLTDFQKVKTVLDVSTLIKCMLEHIFLTELTFLAIYIIVCVSRSFCDLLPKPLTSDKAIRKMIKLPAFLQTSRHFSMVAVESRLNQIFFMALTALSLQQPKK